MTVQMNHGTGGVVTLQAPASGSGTVTIPAVTGIIAGPRVSFSTDGTVLSGYGVSLVSRVSTGIYDITRTVAAADENYGLSGSAWTADSGSVGLDGSNDYITASNITALSSQSAFTVFGRYKLNSTVSQVFGMFQQRQSSSAYCGLRTFTDGTTYLYHDSDSSNYAQVASSTAGITAGTWFTAAVVYDGTQTGNSNRLKLYVNGTQISLTFFGTIGSSYASNTGAFEVGRWNYAGSFSYGNGSVSRIAVYSTALTAGNITTLNGGADYGSPVLHWKFSELSGTNLADSSGNSRNGTLTNGPTWTTIDGAPLVMRVLSRSTTVARVEFRTSTGATIIDPTEASVTMVV